MKQGQGFLLVFSITSLSSLNELSELREQIIRIKDDENVPIVIVGNKSDLEEDRRVTRGHAFALSRSWDNVPYFETSARRKANVNEVFLNLCRQIMNKDLEERNGGGGGGGGNNLNQLSSHQVNSGSSDLGLRKRNGLGGKRRDRLLSGRSSRRPCVIL